MNGAESLVESLLASGVDVCFANPGTSEMHIVAALDRRPSLRSILALFEGVVTGAADGYARMTGKPAATLLHLGPGLANGLANLHNAMRARVPIVNLVGQHATYHIPLDTPLTSDIEGIARPYSKWQRTSSHVARIGQDAVEAVVASLTPPGQIATLVLPADLAWSDGGVVAPVPVFPRASLPASSVIDSAAAKLGSTRPAALLLAGNALFGPGLRAAGRVAAVTGARLFAPYPFTRLERGAGLPPVERIPYILEQAMDALKEFPLLVLVGSAPPISYFAAQGKNASCTPPGCELFTLAKPEEDVAGALDALAGALNARSAPPVTAQPHRPALSAGPLTLPGIAAVLGALLPPNAVIVEESMTSGRAILPSTAGCDPHDILANTGGSIGIAMPLAVGAAVASPGRRVLCLSADGSGMYTLQALWTMVRENLDVTTVIFANRSYSVLKREYSYLGVGEPGPVAAKLFNIGDPDLDWVSLAKGMGVPAARVLSLDDLANLLRKGFATPGPSLIEIPL